jgi:large subunit ribosomal protein L18
MKTSPKTIKRQVRRNRIRAKIKGTKEMPRLSIFKSNKYIYAELIDDDSGKTLCASSGQSYAKDTKSDQAKKIGADIAKKAKEHGIEKAVFDRGGYIYTGRVRAVADAAREGGLKF